MAIRAKNTLISFILYFSKESTFNDLWNKLLQEKPTGHVGSSEREILRFSLMFFFFFFQIDVDDDFFEPATYTLSAASFHLFYRDEELEWDSL